MSFFRGLLVVAGVGALAFVALTGVGMTAMSNYGATHDMTVDVPLEEVLLLDPMTSFDTLCAGEHHPSWDAVCAAPRNGIEKTQDIRTWVLEKIEDYER